MKMLSVRDFPDEWRMRLRVESVKRGMTVGQLLVVALEGYLGDSVGLHEESDKEQVVKNDANAVVKKDVDIDTYVWRTTRCPKHKQFPVLGKWRCCNER